MRCSVACGTFHHLMIFVIVSPLTFSKEVPISELSRSCSAILIFRPHRFTHTFPAKRFKPPIIVITPVRGENIRLSAITTVINSI
ncbi:MAG: hypothetical protein UZ16_OP3001002790 [Candidatus Hinthialibacteria bacterium OLB16]|nr:MAG: hypothetical protein UZ16_OP3001002790 [Candidatus Hinthialibacteria bacterium OLB16]